MIIRLMSHSKDNAEHIDKLIVIDGLPEEWVFERREETDEKGEKDTRLFLKHPWEDDVTENLPEGIRLKFQPEPIEVWYETPMEIRPGTYTAQDKIGWVRWLKKIYGFRLNLQTNQGQQMWDQIVDLLDRETPRSQRIPEPAVVGTKIIWTLEASKVPYVKLTGTLEVPAKETSSVAVSVPPVVIEPEPIKEARPDEYSCHHCGEIFDKERGRYMHERRKHGAKGSFIKSREVSKV